MVKDISQVRTVIQLDKLKAVQKANKKVEELISVVRQNIGYCEENPTLAALGKVDALSAAKELAKAAEEVLQKVKDLNDGYQQNIPQTDASLQAACKVGRKTPPTAQRTNDSRNVGICSLRLYVLLKPRKTTLRNKYMHSV